MAEVETVIDGAENKKEQVAGADVAADIVGAKNAKVAKPAKKVAKPVAGAKDLDDVAKAVQFALESVASLYGKNVKREKLRRMLGGLKMAEHWLNLELAK